MAEFGLTPPEIINDSKIHRFKNEGDNNKNSWYIAFDNGDFQAGAFGCWKRDIHEKFCSLSSSSLSTEQRQLYAQQMRQQQQLFEEVKLRQQERVQNKSNQRFNSASTDNVDIHPYLQQKQVQSFGLRIIDTALLIPLFNTDGEMCNIQSVSDEGEKYFAQGGQVKGCFFMIGTPEKYLILCEGYATGASIHQATGEAVVVCFNAGNIKDVGKELSIKYPDISLMIAADDDQFNERNTGFIKAKETAKHLGASFTFPRFKDADLSQKPTDFNDLHQLYGLDEVNMQIKEALSSVKKTYNLQSFIFYDSFFKAMKSMSGDEKLEFFNSICNYGLYRKTIHLSPIVQGFFEMAKPQLDANYKRRKDGNKGGRPRNK